MNILVVGLGALGTVYSCLLKEQGHRVTVLAKKGAEDVLRRQGVSVTGIWGEHRAVPDRVVSDPDVIDKPDFDLILITVKSFDTYEALNKLKKLVTARTYVVLLQNGYGNFEAAACAVPKNKILLGRVIFGAETEGIGISKVTVIADDVIIGSPENLVDSRILEELAEAFQKAGIPTRTSSEILKYVWGKVIYNSALNPLGAIFEVNYGKLAENEHTKGMIDDIIEEIFRLLTVMGQETWWPDAAAYKKDFYEKMLPTTAAHHASMLQDIRRGRKTEIDALNGAIVQLGHKYKLQLPVNDFISRMVKAKEKFYSV